MKLRVSSIVAPLAALLSLAEGLTLDVTSQDSVKSVTSTLAYDMMSFYSGNQTGQTPGLLPGPCASTACYYWWEAGAMFGALINYWQYTGDSSYNSVVSQALQFQIGPDQNYNPPNQSKDMGVDDQAFWAFSALDAAEANFPEAGGDAPSWVALAQAVYNFQAALWDDSTCGGGMRWQVYSFNSGYNLKNTISNGGNFQLAARLAYYTGNSTYSDWAVKMWDWMEASVLFQTQDNILYIWDNTDVDNNCSDVTHLAWSYNYGTMLMGAAYMYNYTGGDATWEARVQQILAGADYLFFPASYGGNIMSEFECEAPSNCDSDQSSFKAYLARWMAVTTLLVPSTYDTIMPKLQASASAAAQQCTGGDNGRMCGRRWYSSWDGTQGVGQQVCQLLSDIGSVGSFC
jgi:mannan endo-1,6-alpha-mannosidase